jgi:DNA-binding LacI/PurR family transcriptional regulator
MAVDLLVRKLDGRSLAPEHLTLPVKLIEKESV